MKKPKERNRAKDFPGVVGEILRRMNEGSPAEPEPTVEEMTEYLRRFGSGISTTWYLQIDDDKSWLAELRGFPPADPGAMYRSHVIAMAWGEDPNEALRALYGAVREREGEQDGNT